MKKAFLAIIVLCALAFAAITIAKRRGSEVATGEVAPADAARQRIRDFWAVYNRANDFRIRGDFADAVPAYREALQLNPQHEDSLYYLGASLEELGNYADAAKCFRRLIALNPSSGRALGELGHVLSVLAPGAPRDFAGARQALLRNIEVNREQAGPFIRLGLLELDQGHAQAAAEQFRLASGFGSPEGTFLLGYALFLQNRYREAMPDFQKVVDAYWRDRKATAKGVTQEGDILPAPGKPLTPLARAGFKSLLFLYWSAQRLGGYPDGVPKEFQIHPAELARISTPATSFADLGPSAVGKRVVSADFEGNSRLDRVEAGAGDASHPPLRFFRNTGQRFVDATPQAGFAARSTAVHCAVSDFDGDGKPDLFVTYWRQGAVLYRNLGNGKFQDVTEQAGLKDLSGESFGALFFDYDRDGLPDLLVTHYAPYEDVVRCLLQPAFQAPWSSPRLFHNLGHGRFEEVTRSVGLDRAYGTIEAVAADIDGDGWPDLLLVNGSLDAQRLEPSVILRNLQGKGFREWSYLPSSDAPGNLLAARVVAEPRGRARIELWPNPLSRNFPQGGGFTPRHLAASQPTPR